MHTQQRHHVTPPQIYTGSMIPMTHARDQGRYTPKYTEESKIKKIENRIQYHEAKNQCYQHKVLIKITHYHQSKKSSNASYILLHSTTWGYFCQHNFQFCSRWCIFHGYKLSDMKAIKKFKFQANKPRGKFRRWKYMHIISPAVKKGAQSKHKLRIQKLS
jgi:hypothetical protein